MKLVRVEILKIINNKLFDLFRVKQFTVPRARVTHSLLFIHVLYPFLNELFMQLQKLYRSI